MDVNLTIVILSVVLNFSLGVVVFTRNRKPLINKIFLISIFFLILYAISNYNIDTAKTPREALMWLKFLTVFFTFSTYFFFLFITLFPKPNLKKQLFAWFHLTVFIYAIVIVPLLSFSKLAFVEVTLGQKGLEQITFGSLYLPMFIGIFILTVVNTVLMIKKNRQIETKRIKKQMQYMIIGWTLYLLFSIAFAAIIPFFVPAAVNASKIFPLFSVVMVGFTTYAIVRHQLMDIRVVIQRGLIYSILAALILIFYVALLNVLWFIFQQQTDVTAFFSAATTTLLAVFSVPIIERFLRKVTDKIFFKDKYNYSEALHELSEVLNKNIKLENTLRSISETLKSILRIGKVRLVLIPQNILFDEKGILQKIEKFYSDKLIEEHIKHPDVIVHANIPYMLEQSTLTAEWKKVLKEIRRLGEKSSVAVSVPIILEYKLIGFIGLGKKLSGDSYTSEDIKLLETFSYQAAVAIEKARLYEEVAEYSKELEKKVKERTQEIEKLQQAQKQMMMDISHGLQTPLTTIKSELSFLKKQIPPNKKVSVFEKSIDEVSLFIYDLLKLAQLEAGEEKFKKESVSLSKMLHEQVEYFKVIAEHKHIVLKSSIKEGITIFGDKKKLEELTINLVSNAIKYMKQKGKREIHIGLESINNTAKLTITDSGVGIRAQDLPHIFERFHRVENFNNTHTKGTGLGLAICKKIVEKHEGTIAVTSKLGEGATFIVTLPVAPKSDTKQ